MARSETSLASPGPSAEPGATSWAARGYRVLRFLLALLVFVGALQLMKTGAKSLDVLSEGGFLVTNAGSTLGLGWLGALLVLSGSPIAATALALVAAGSIQELQGFTMLTGSRLGAAFVVLVVAVIYALRGGEGERVKPVSTAVIALTTTAVIYIPAALIGWFTLRWSSFHSIELHFPNQFSDLLDLIYGGLLDRVESLPAAVIFLAGLGVLLLSFKLIDAAMPPLNEETLGEKRLAWLKGKWTMFGLGSLVALITMSVSVALTVLVPFVSKKYVKREDIIPYIMGANITTLGDTMLAAFALNSPAAVRIVFAEVLATTLLSVFLLAFFYPQLRRGIWKFQRQMVRSKPRLASFTAGLFLVPLAIVGISGWLR